MTLSETAAALRATHQHHAERKAPVENGERLVTIPRHDGDELRLNWAEYTTGTISSTSESGHKATTANCFRIATRG